MKLIPYYQVNLRGGYLFEKQELNTRTTIPAVYDRFYETGRINAFKLEGLTFETLAPVTAPTGITDIIQAQPGTRVIYNISGQRLKELQKGINIVDGKKILNK